MILKPKPTNKGMQLRAKRVACISSSLRSGPTDVVVRVCLIVSLLLTICLTAGGRGFQSNDYGPEVKSFLDLMRHEEDELEFLFRNNQVPRREYLRAKAQITIHRQAVLKIVQETGEDRVPELHVVAASEVDQLIEDGLTALKGVKEGEIIRDKWRYLGSVRRGETFYIFERLTMK